MKAFNFKDCIILEDDRVKIVPLELSHFDLLLDIVLNDKGLLKYSPSPIDSEMDLENYISTAIQTRRNSERYPFIIYDKTNRGYAGSSSYGNISNKDSRLEIGWTWIGRKFQGTGLNRTVKFLMLQYAFEELRFSRVEFKIDSRNTQSRRAVEKIGGIFEGELRSHTVMTNGFTRNTVYYSILENEWELVKKEGVNFKEV
jgi:RimJ/RimL family protein N-acetyltransferase